MISTSTGAATVLAVAVSIHRTPDLVDLKAARIRLIQLETRSDFSGQHLVKFPAMPFLEETMSPCFLMRQPSSPGGGWAVAVAMAVRTSEPEAPSDGLFWFWSVRLVIAGLSLGIRGAGRNDVWRGGSGNGHNQLN